MSTQEMPLVGDDGSFMTGTLGDIITGDAIKTIDALIKEKKSEANGEGYYIIKKMAAESSVIPKGMKVGELYPALGTEVLATGDELQRLDLTKVGDCTGWEISITQSEIEVTRLKDHYKKYRLGKKDASGTVNSIMTLGESDRPEGMVGRSIKLFRRENTPEGSQKVTVTEEANKALYFLGWVRETELAGETKAFIFGQVYLSNVKLGGQSGSAQSYDSNMRLTGPDPIFYSLDNPIAA